MLIGIHPLLTPDLLHALASMGHGDEVVIADANFPSTSVGRRVIALPGVDAPAALAAVLTVLPLDAASSPAVFTMEVAGDPRAIALPVAAFAGVFAERGMADVEFGALGRHAFYERARQAYAVVRTGELRPYGNVLLVKGTVNRWPPAT